MATTATDNEYYKGEDVRVRAVFRDEAGTLTDPSTITLQVKDPGGTTDSYTYAGGTITREATGIYYKVIDVDDDGVWYYRFSSTGTPKAAREKSFTVLPTEF